LEPVASVLIMPSESTVALTSTNGHLNLKMLFQLQTDHMGSTSVQKWFLTELQAFMYSGLTTYLMQRPRFKLMAMLLM
jgi:hypothetical protein